MCKLHLWIKIKIQVVNIFFGYKSVYFDNINAFRLALIIIFLVGKKIRKVDSCASCLLSRIFPCLHLMTRDLKSDTFAIPSLVDDVLRSGGGELYKIDTIITQTVWRGKFFFESVGRLANHFPARQPLLARASYGFYRIVSYAVQSI